MDKKMMYKRSNKIYIYIFITHNVCILRQEKQT